MKSQSLEHTKVYTILLRAIMVVALSEGEGLVSQSHHNYSKNT